MAASLEQKMTTEDKTETEFSVKSETDDFVLIVEGKKLNVPKLVLILASPVFDKMFKSDFKEKNHEELELKDKKYDDVLKFLKCIHPSIMAPVTMLDVFAVVPLAHEYMVRPLTNQCDVVMSSSTSESTPVETLCYYLYLANKFQLQALEVKCRILAGQRSNESQRVKFNAAAEKHQVPFESQTIIYKAMFKTQISNICKACTEFSKVNCTCAHVCYPPIQFKIDKVVKDIKKHL